MDLHPFSEIPIILVNPISLYTKRSIIYISIEYRNIFLTVQVQVMVRVVFLDGNTSSGKARKFEGDFVKHDANFIYLMVNGELKAIGKPFIVKIEGIDPEELG